MKPTTVAALSLMLIGGAVAGAVAVSPLYLQVNPSNELGTSVNVGNQDTSPTSFRAEVVTWEQINGENVYKPARDTIVNPASFTVSPGRTQVVRVGLRSRPTGFKAYRLIIVQQPKASEALNLPLPEGKSGNIAVTLRIGVPLFFKYETAQAQPKYALTRQGDKVSVVVTNSGNAQASLRSIQATFSQGEQTLGEAQSLGNVHVLPGGSQTLILDKVDAKANKVVLEYQDGNGQPGRAALTLP